MFIVDIKINNLTLWIHFCLKHWCINYILLYIYVSIHDDQKQK